MPRPTVLVLHILRPLTFAMGVTEADNVHVTCLVRKSSVHIQGGPAKVKPTYIFDGNI